MPHNFPLFQDFADRREKIAVVGLGYVGLPLSVALSELFTVIGFDLSRKRIKELRRGLDRTGEVSPAALAASGPAFSSSPADIGEARFIIAAVPTPIDAHRNPDLEPLRSASALIGRHMRPGSVVVYESTVYPGASEEVCIPILERESGLRCGPDFALGYSPERVNPGDRAHRVENIVKVVSASSPQALDLAAGIYGAVVRAGIHRAPSIKVAEAAKVIENTQRDLNIALMNELSLIFDRLGIDTLDVLEAAETKWNFLPFRPGLVGGHCIGVDPYYLTFKAQAAGLHPEVILAGRRINDGMGKYIAEKTVKLLIAQGRRIVRSRVGIFGLTFKENVPDLRNSRIPGIKAELEEYGINVLVHDPLADPDEAMCEYGVSLSPLEAMCALDAAVFSVAHSPYAGIGLENLAQRFRQGDRAVLLDLKGIWKRSDAENAGFAYWRL
ncbi:MAG: nucleotide sugar dehydrogenase [Desulfovibrio sp.]|jgi:UDP-N-acetyl-D-galactosamine dehydrogenase|nr:nucleotide sugar dehydrogenase [Desulfovibrio sp.]